MLHKLSAATVTRIKAQQVITGLVAVVKELIEYPKFFLLWIIPSSLSYFPLVSFCTFESFVHFLNFSSTSYINALDAGATNIQVKLEGDGLAMIQV